MLSLATRLWSLEGWEEAVLVFCKLTISRGERQERLAYQLCTLYPLNRDRVGYKSCNWKFPNPW